MGYWVCPDEGFDPENSGTKGKKKKVRRSLSEMSGKRGEEEVAEEERSRVKVARQEEREKKPGLTRVTWLGLGEKWGVVRDVRKMIFKILTPLERVTVEKAHGVRRAFERHKKDVCLWAADRGHLPVLQWARENGCPWDEKTCSYAAEEGHLAVLQWARENGCPWDADTCSLAAAGGHLAVLQWARENGCPWDEWVCSFAAKGGHLDVLEWARANVVRGTATRARLQQKGGIWKCCNGLV